MERTSPISLIGALLLVFRHIGVAIGSGSTYSLALLGLDDVENPSITYTLVFTSTETVGVTATIEDLHYPPIRVVIPAAGIVEQDLAQPYSLNGSEITNKTVHVSSVTGTFNLQVFSKFGDEHVEGFLAIPRESLLGPRAIQGTYEYITTTFCAISGFCQFAISAFEDNTGVSVEFKTTTEEVVMCNGKGYFRSHRDKNIFLDKFDSVQFESAADLTGVRIYSFKPIAVFVGSRNVTQGDKVVHMVEQLHPSSQWGTQYAVRTLGSNGYGDILKISTYWPNTTIDMKGFPVFVATHWSHNIWRRLDKGMSTFITASKPIQVVQITGLAYATADDVTSAGMTVVPAIENGANNFTVSCGSSKAGEFHIVSGALNSITTSVNGVPSTAENIAYTQYGIANFSATAGDVHLVANPTATISGIVKCEETAVMPLGLLHQPIGGTTTTTTVNPTFCKEMIHATTTGFDPLNTNVVGRHEIVFGEFQILQLRVRTCSDLTVQFLEDLDMIGNYVLFVVRSNTICLYKCYPHCNESAVEVDISSFKGTQFDCKVDMSLYWFRLVTSGANHYLCFGPGPLAPRDGTTCTTDPNMSIELNAPFSRALMRATPGGAVYNYDLETEADCDFRESSWRCEDKSTVCEEYGPTICTREVVYAQSHCAKFCKLCRPDNYGRKFLVLKPPVFTDHCYLYVTGYRVTPNVAVATSDKLLHVEKAEARTKVYECTPASNRTAIAVFADADVSVSVVYKTGDPTLTAQRAVMSYPVYPVDSFGREFLLLVATTGWSRCLFVAERSSVSIMTYFSGSFGSLQDRVAFDVGYNDVEYAELTGPPNGLFQSEASFTIVCGSGFHAWSTNQMTPTETWGTRYVVPELETTPGNLPFDPEITIISNRDNTVINIDGDFNAVHTMRYRGETVTQVITGRSSYTVTSSHPVGVALVFKHPTEANTRSVHLLPPSERFTSAQLLTVPNVLLKILGMAVPNSIATCLVTTAGVSTIQETTYPSAGDQFDTRFFSTGAQFGISVAQTDTGAWLSLTGHQTFDHYIQTDYCQTSTPEANDGKDNDCDTLIDEDTGYFGYGVYSDDFDLDGGFREDFCCLDTNAAIIGKPTEPQCLEILKPANQCWTICRVNCDWITSLDNYNRMTEEEKTSLHEAVAAQQKKVLSVDESSLSSTTSAKESATDERTSAQGIGLVGVGLFAAVFGTIFIMDIQSLIRDIMLTGANIREGVGRFRNFIRRDNA